MLALGISAWARGEVKLVALTDMAGGRCRLDKRWDLVFGGGRPTKEKKKVPEREREIMRLFSVFQFVPPKDT